MARRMVREMTIYQKQIAEILKKKNIDVDARHVEGFMRLQFSTLNNIDAKTFFKETLIGAACALEDKNMAESNAISFGL